MLNAKTLKEKTKQKCVCVCVGGGGGVLPVYLRKCKIPILHPIPITMFKTILGTFEAEILKISKNFQPQPKNYTFL